MLLWFWTSVIIIGYIALMHYSKKCEEHNEAYNRLRAEEREARIVAKMNKMRK